jgi:hypothetical protein
LTTGSLALAMVFHAQGDRSALRLQLARLTPIAARSEDIQEVASHGVVEAASLLLDGRADEALRAATRTVRAAYRSCAFATTGSASDGRWLWKPRWPPVTLTRADHLLALVTEAPRGHVPPYLWAQLAHYRALIARGAGRPDRRRDRPAARNRGPAGLGYPYWTARTQADLGRWLVAQGGRRTPGPC